MSKINKNLNIIIATILVAILAIFSYYFFGKEKEISIPLNLEIPKNMVLEKEGFPEEQINFEWTDDNTGEDLIIQSDKQTYFGVNESIVYFSMTNLNQQDQEVNLRFLFESEGASLSNIEKINPDSSNPSGQAKSISSLTSTDKPTLKFKSIKGFTSSDKYYLDNIKSGETNYYQGTINYPPNSKGEFYIESKGNNGAYGLLDPFYDSSGLVGYWSFDGNDSQGLGYGNNFSADSNIKSLYSFENASFVTDSIGNNNLTNSGVTTDSSVHKEGSFSGNWEDSQTDYMYISNANLDAGHPFKSGYSGKTFSVCSWFNVESFNAAINRYIVNSYGITTNGRSFNLSVDMDDNMLRIMLGYNSGNNYVEIKHGTALNTGTWYHACTTYDDNSKLATIRIWDDTAQAIVGTDVADSTTMSGKTWYSTNQNLSIGSISSLNGSWFDGRIDEIAIFDDVLSTAEIDQIRSGFYKTILLDRSGQGNDGNATGDIKPTIGKVGQALSFDGVDDYIVVDSSSQFDSSSTDEFSYSFWVDASSYSSKQVIISRRNGCNNDAHFNIYISGNKIYFGFYSNLDAAGSLHSSASTITDGVPYHITWVKKWGVEDVSLYLNGVEVSVNGASSLNGTSYSGLPVVIGAQWSGSFCYSLPLLTSELNSFFKGSIDEVLIYNKALSSDEVSQLYRKGSRTSKTNTSNVGRLTSGLVAHWTFDGADMDWSSTTAEVLDRSGNGNGGNVIGDTKPSAGKVGQALEFDGTGDYVNAGDVNGVDGVSELTLSTWFYRDNSANVLNIEKGPNISNKLGINLNGNILYLNVGNGGNYYGQMTNRATGWQHIVMVFDGAGATNPDKLKCYIGGVEQTIGSFTTLPIALDDNSSDFMIGYSPVYNLYSDGKIDEVAVYDRALSPTEITELYNMGAKKIITNTTNVDRLTSGLVGNWTFDGADIDWGTNTAIDRSGQGNNGTIINMSTTTSPAIGKIGQALSFNGTAGCASSCASYGLVTTPSFSLGENLSTCFWAKPKRLEIKEMVIHGTSSTGGFELYQSGSGIVIRGGGSSPSVSGLNALIQDQWSFVCGTISGTTGKVYSNGVLLNTGTVTTPQTTASQLGIGGYVADGGYAFNGFLDEVYVYNRTLSSDEITELYNMGAKKFKIR